MPTFSADCFLRRPAPQALEKLDQNDSNWQSQYEREENRIKRRMRQAGFPFEKTIEQFDFALRPELKRQVVLNCMDETFVHQGRSMVLIGPPGTGKPQPRKCISRIDSFY